MGGETGKRDKTNMDVVRERGEEKEDKRERERETSTVTTNSRSKGSSPTSNL